MAMGLYVIDNTSVLLAADADAIIAPVAAGLSSAWGNRSRAIRF
jgi:hypothetical protein